MFQAEAKLEAGAAGAEDREGRGMRPRAGGLDGGGDWESWLLASQAFLPGTNPGSLRA